MDTNITEFLSRLPYILPHIAVWIAAIVICTQYREHRKNETRFLIIGFGILIAEALINTLVQSWLISNYDGTSLLLSRLFSITYAVSIVLHLIAWALILTGIYQLLQQKHASKETR